MAEVFDADGKQVEEINLAAESFGVATDINLLHLAVRAEQAARRSGTASTKTRGEISGSTAKLYRQKGTGRARAGSVKSPTRSGGGTAFGPKPRSYELKLNRKAARKALPWPCPTAPKAAASTSPGVSSSKRRQRRP